jgi:hypothetical protein
VEQPVWERSLALGMVPQPRWDVQVMTDLQMLALREVAWGRQQTKLVWRRQLEEAAEPPPPVSELLARWW